MIDPALYLGLPTVLGCGVGYFAQRRLSGCPGRGRRVEPVVYHNVVLVTSAPMAIVQARLAELAGVGRAAGPGKAVRMWPDYPHRVVYEYFGVAGNGEHGGFTAVITFQYLGARELRAVMSIDSSAGPTGSVGRSESAAVRRFVNSVVEAFQAVDPMVHVSR